MSRKLKFKPEITRVKLNPEQAVLACSCYDAEEQVAADLPGALNKCIINTRNVCESGGPVGGFASTS